MNTGVIQHTDAGRAVVVEVFAAVVLLVCVCVCVLKGGGEL